MTPATRDGLRILFVTSSYPAAAEDPRGIFVHRLAREIVRQGDPVTVLAPGAPGAPRREVRDGVEVIRHTYWVPRWQALTRGLPGIVPNLQHRPWLALQLAPLVAGLLWQAALEARRHDVVHAHWIYPGGMVGLVAARLTGRPLVITSHGGDVNLAARVPVLRTFCRLVCRGAAACVGVSEAVRDALIALGVPAARVRFVPLGVDPTVDAAPAPEPDALVRFREGDGLRVLYLGSLTERKSVRTLVDAHARLERAGERVTTAIVGDGPAEAALHAAVHGAGLQRLVMTGAQPPATVPAWLSAADVLVLPSRSEGRPTVIIEAMACGVPVIATDIPGTRELVQPGRTGLLFPVGDEAALADRLRQLLAEPRAGEAMGTEGRARVEAEGLTASASARRYREIYARVVGPALLGRPQEVREGVLPEP